MPIVLIRSLAPPDPHRVQQMLTDVAAALAVALDSSAEDVWAYWQPVQAAAIGARTMSFDGHCPVVTVLARKGRTIEEIGRGLHAVASAVAGALAIPHEDVWIHWQDVPPGQIFAGGRVL